MSNRPNVKNETDKVQPTIIIIRMYVQTKRINTTRKCLLSFDLFDSRN
jgi:hypothetical protein